MGNPQRIGGGISRFPLLAIYPNWPKTYCSAVRKHIFAAASFALLLKFVEVVFESQLAARLSVLLLTLYPEHGVCLLVITEILYTCLLLSISVLLVTRQSLTALC